VSIMLDAIKGLNATHAKLAGLARAVSIGTILCGAGLMASCHAALTEGRGSMIPVIDSLQGSSVQKSGSGGTFDSVLKSDVETGGGVFEDNGQVTIHLEPKDISQTPTSNNAVTFNHYRVEFRRTDGRNAQGVDVPYAFEGAITFTVPASGSASSSFSLVRAQAKLEPPLITLVHGGGEIVISTIADVTFYGHDTTGEPITVKGSISVNFADWADPAS
jgi:hypothetical protein